MKSSTKEMFCFGFILLISLNVFSCKFLGQKLKAFSDDDEIAKITTDSEYDLLDAIELLNENGGTIYIDTPVINMYKTTSLTIDGNFPGGIIGLRQPNGGYPRINFQENDIDTQFFSGINIYGSNKFIEYLIIENSLSYGVNIEGNNNIFDHVISRYNFGSGFIIKGDFNTLNYCYSYRNCDANIYVVNADGFQISGEQNNVFNYCFAWDNANTGFNYIRVLNSSDLNYLHSASWNNGNINVFTGKYDYDNGNPLDNNLWTIQEIIKTDPNFVSNYYNKKYSFDNAFLEGIPAEEWAMSVSPRMDAVGFIFASKDGQSIDVKRNSLYNVAFGHRGGGFIDKFSNKFNAYVTNCAAFDNSINYRLPFYNFLKWSNNWSWGGLAIDIVNSASIEKPKNENTHRNSFYSVRDQIVKSVTANIFPDGINFDRVISLLN